MSQTATGDQAGAPPKQSASGLTSRFLRDDLPKGATGMLLLRIAQIALEFLGSLVLARLLGASSYGAYAFALSWAGLLGVPAAVGFDRLLIREIAKFQARGEWPLMRGMLRRTNQIVLAASVVVAAIAAIWAQVLEERIGSEMASALQLGMIIVPLIAVARLRQAALQGLGRVVWGQVPETLLQPFMLLCLLGGAYLFFGKIDTGPTAVALRAAAGAGACLAGVVLLRRSLPAEVSAATPDHCTRAWLITAMPFLWILSMNVVVNNTDVIMLGLLVGPESAGIYRIANQAAGLITFPLTAVNMALAPTIPGLYVRKDYAGLQEKATRAAQAILLMALPICVILTVFGRSILSLSGAEFVVGYPALAILNCGYVLNVAMGTSGYLLIMTKHERAAALTFACGAAINVAANLTLVPIWGVNGAAVAMALSISVVSVVFAILAYRRLAIQPTAFFMRWRPNRLLSAHSAVADGPHDTYR